MRGSATLSPARPSVVIRASGIGSLGTPPCPTWSAWTRASGIGVLLLRAERPRRHAAPQFAGRHVAVDERHRGDRGPFADDHARQERAVRADGRAAPDDDRPDAVPVRAVLVAED